MNKTEGKNEKKRRMGSKKKGKLKKTEGITGRKGEWEAR